MEKDNCANDEKEKMSKMLKFVDDYGMEFGYGDTDSVFLILHKLFTMKEVEDAMKKIQHWINKESGLFAGTTMEMSSEHYVGFLQNKKKKYALIVEKNGVKKVSLKGMECRAATKYSRALLKQILNMGMLDHASKFDIEKVIHKACVALWKKEIDRKMLLHTTQISKPIELYKGNDAHIVAAQQLIDIGREVRVGKRQGYYYCNTVLDKNAPKYERVIAEEILEMSPERYCLHMHSYVEEVKSMIVANALMFISGNTVEERERRLDDITSESNRLKEISENIVMSQSTLNFKRVKVDLEDEDDVDDPRFDAKPAPKKRKKKVQKTKIDELFQKTTKKAIVREIKLETAPAKKMKQDTINFLK